MQSVTSLMGIVCNTPATESITRPVVHPETYRGLDSLSRHVRGGPDESLKHDQLGRQLQLNNKRSHRLPQTHRTSRSTVVWPYRVRIGVLNIPHGTSAQCRNGTGKMAPKTQHVARQSDAVAIFGSSHKQGSQTIIFELKGYRRSCGCAV